MGEDDSIVPLLGPDGHRQWSPGTPQPWENADRAQAAVDGATGPEPPAPPSCPNCGLAGERRLTYTGQHVLLEPRLTVPAHLVPGGHRWYIDANGIAWNGGLDAPLPGAHCRIPHQLACPGLTLDEIQPWRWLAAVRDYNGLLVQQTTHEKRRHEGLPDAG
ncbi:DUF6083 domain-containing protein [Streptomyces sp. NPDC052101]|uniref:DUF6083 domain-containing protein n=1 Tax=Streptomyces sp. NPDC052101 TaxID=3155763 RepID=UPI003448327E